jgi:hypothetical protein
MGKYTALDDPEANAAVQEVLDKVVERVVSLLGNNLQAIVLVGSYGRGEGGVYKFGSNYNLVNDLDLLAFVKNGLKNAKERFDSSLKNLSHQLLKYGKGLKEIDIELTNVWRYRYFITKTVSYYEIAKGHQVIYGNLNLNKVMPRIKPEQLPTYEGTNYFRNRGSGLLIPALYFFTDGLKTPEKRKNFQIELQKGCQAMGDALLLMTSKYHFSYRERLNRFIQLKQNQTMIPADLFERVAPLYEWGMTGKLTPSFDWPGDQEMINKWFEMRGVFGDFFLWYESTRLRYKFRGWDEYAQYIENHGATEPFDLKLRSILLSVQWFIQKRNRRKNNIPPIHRTRSILKIMPLLLFSLTPDLQVEPFFVEKAASMMGYQTSDIDLALWKSLTQEFLLFHYPTNVVRKAVLSQ